MSQEVRKLRQTEALDVVERLLEQIVPSPEDLQRLTLCLSADEYGEVAVERSLGSTDQNSAVQREQWAAGSAKVPIMTASVKERVPSKAPTLPEPSRAYVYGSIEGYEPRTRSDEQPADASMPYEGNVMDELDALF
ncbi:hypothetical protein WJX73_008971 [Symbiochloris irregularis]|uniref:Uncharacterized protein n=1 Tax=Symbiochloris irregularis TaxID=706552 RepID=A0AAW1Q2W5_9CHLO